MPIDTQPPPNKNAFGYVCGGGWVNYCGIDNI
jgi:hypothetical protein